jgi:hypothetical protein
VFFSIRGREAFVHAVGMLVCAACLFHASNSFSAVSTDNAASAAPAASDPVTSLINAESLPAAFSGDDPEHVRDALSGHLTPAAASRAPSVASRVRSFIQHPLRQLRHGESASAVLAASDSAQAPQANRTFFFVIPASYGVRYEVGRQLLSVDMSLASPEEPGAILLKQSVTGQSGRKLVIAPEAKAKGFIQTFDTIQFKTGAHTLTSVKGRTLAPKLDHASNGDFAIVLVCTLEPPYMTERTEHSDPTDEEPTDITRKTSTLLGVVDAVWLIDHKDGTIITKRLRLSK